MAQPQDNSSRLEIATETKVPSTHDVNAITPLPRGGDPSHRIKRRSRSASVVGEIDKAVFRGGTVRDRIPVQCCCSRRQEKRIATFIGNTLALILLAWTFLPSPVLANLPEYSGLYVYCRVFCFLTGLFTIWGVLCMLNFAVTALLFKTFQFWYLQTNVLLAIICIGLTVVEAEIMDWSLAMFYGIHVAMLSQGLIMADALQTRRRGKLFGNAVFVGLALAIFVWIWLDDRLWIGLCVKVPWLRKNSDNTTTITTTSLARPEQDSDSICSGVIGRSALLNALVFMIKLAATMVLSPPGTCVILSKTVEFVRDKETGDIMKAPVDRSSNSNSNGDGGGDGGGSVGT